MTAHAPRPEARPASPLAPGFAGTRSALRATIASKTAAALGLLGLRREDIALECHLDSVTGQSIVLVDVRLNLPALWTYVPHVEAFVIEHLSQRYGLRLSKLRLQMDRNATERAEDAPRVTGQRPQVPGDAERTLLLNPAALTLQRADPSPVCEMPGGQGAHGGADRARDRSPGQASSEDRTGTPARGSRTPPKFLFARYAEAFVTGKPLPWR